MEAHIEPPTNLNSREVEVRRAYKKQWRMNHKEEIKLYQRAYMKNNNNRDDDYSIDVSMIDTNTELIKDNTAKNSKNVNNIIVRVSSTTIITAFLTYVIFFVL